jgi:protein-S-isoprenylcysteine O-methyltransferase Ste14
MFIPIILCISIWIAYLIEEFILIKPISSISKSDLRSKRLEIMAFGLPPIGMGATLITAIIYGGFRLFGVVNAFGLLLSILGLGLRFWSRKVLGRYFTIGVIKQEGHKVIQIGPYKYIRHPAYLAFIMFYLGFPLITGNWVGLLILSMPLVIIFICLIVVEDDHLQNTLGQEYEEYQRRSSRIIPGIW